MTENDMGPMHGTAKGVLLGIGILKTMAGSAGLLIGVAMGGFLTSLFWLWVFFIVAGFFYIYVSFRLNSKMGKRLGICLLYVLCLQFPIGTILGYVGLKDLLGKEPEFIP